MSGLVLGELPSVAVIELSGVALSRFGVYILFSPCLPFIPFWVLSFLHVISIQDLWSFLFTICHCKLVLCKKKFLFMSRLINETYFWRLRCLSCLTCVDMSSPWTFFLHTSERRWDYWSGALSHTFINFGAYSGSSGCGAHNDYKGGGFGTGAHPYFTSCVIGV